MEEEGEGASWEALGELLDFTIKGKKGGGREGRKGIKGGNATFDTNLY